MSHDPDLPLLQAYLGGEAAAFEELVQRHGGPVKAYALRLLRNPELAEDIYVDTFTRVAAHKGAWEQRGTVRGYIFTIAHRLCLDRLRRRQTEMRARDGLIELQRSRAFAPSPEARAAWGQVVDRLEEAIGQLPPEHAQALLLRTVHGLSGAEVAMATGQTEQQVRSKVSYARKLLRELLGSEEEVRQGRRGQES